MKFEHCKLVDNLHVLNIIRVTAVSNTTVKLSFNEDEQLIIREMSETDIQEFNLLAQGIAKMLVINSYID